MAAKDRFFFPGRIGGQGQTALYEGDWLSDVRKIGAEHYYPPLQM